MAQIGAGTPQPEPLEVPEAVRPTPEETWLTEFLSKALSDATAVAKVLGLLDEAARDGVWHAQQWRPRFADLLVHHPTVQVVPLHATTYPANLRRIDRRPNILYVDGSLSDKEDDAAIAVVGTRSPSSAGLDVAHQIGADLARAGYVIVSGLARGVDGAAHRGALSAGCPTIAVIGTGINRVFPPEHALLADCIRHHGAVLSQFPPGSPPTKVSFPARNAVISGVSLGSVVVEAEARSGSRIEANFALSQGRPVFLWGPLLRNRAWARAFAKRSGVRFVESANEVIDLLAQEAKDR